MKPMRAHTYILLITLTYMALYHWPLYAFVSEHTDLRSIGGVQILCCVIVSLFTVTYLLLSLIAVVSLRLLRWTVLFFFISNAIALYFVTTYHVLLDKTMIDNVFHTDTAEALSYYQPKILLYILLWGLFPAGFFFKLRPIEARRYRQLVIGALVLVAGVGIMYLNASTWLWIDKYAKRLGGLAMPWSYTINAMRFTLQEMERHRQIVPLPPLSFNADENNQTTIVVLVIGESARAKNFSLYGYARKTNPLLSQENIIAFAARSTTTYTTASVHSMLSSTGSTSDDREVLPDYLYRYGIDVIWRANNWGSPKLHIRSYTQADALRNMCQGEGCAYDEVLLSGLSKRLKQSQSKRIFVVLHTAGSHGPTYYKKYPPRFERFKPVCKSVELQHCSKEALINAYDNTILYTDHFLSRVIDILKTQDARSMMLYVSDHGESLGEHGFFLHGTPYAIAPDEQKNIPFILWQSPHFSHVKPLPISHSTTLSHYYVFHTVLGAFGASSSIYQSRYDLFAQKPK